MTVRILLHISISFFLAALGIRAFFWLGIFVPIQVSASSMAPTFLGPHRLAVCNQCDNMFSVGVDHGRAAIRATCPACGKRGIDLSQNRVLGGDSIWIDRTTYFFRPPHRWDVVVFRCPNDATQFCVKRIVGLPGEMIDIQGGMVMADGLVVRPPPTENDGALRRYARTPESSRVLVDRLPWQLGPGEYFVLGDNSRVSDDSRTWRSGPGLPHKLLLGKPLHTAW